MFASVAAQDPQRTAGTATDGRGQQGRRDGGDPGRDQVGRVVEPRRGPAEPLVPRAVVADHRVERVHRPVAEQAGEAELPNFSLVIVKNGPKLQEQNPSTHPSP